MTTKASPEMEVHSVEHKHKQIPDDDICNTGKKINFDFELRSDFAWSDDGSERDGLCFSDIHDSVAALREEASTLDAIFAVDQIKTLRAEVASLQRELAFKNEELDELRELVSLKDAIIGTLELECDLYKADFCNQVELKESVSTIMTFESYSDQDQASTRENENQSEHPPSRVDNFVSDLPTNVTPSTSIESSSTDSYNRNVAECIQFFPRQVTRQLDPPSCGSSIQSSCSETTNETTMQPSPGMMYPRSLLLSAHHKPVYASPRKMRALTPQRRIRGRSFPCCFGAGPKNRRKDQAATSKVEVDLEPCELYLQMEQMSHRMHSAVATADELRRRLAMLSRYYESSMHTLRNELVEAKSNRDKVEFDLSRQIAAMDRERRQALEKAEATVQQKRKEKKLKMKAPQTGVV